MGSGRATGRRAGGTFQFFASRRLPRVGLGEPLAPRVWGGKGETISPRVGTLCESGPPRKNTGCSLRFAVRHATFCCVLKQDRLARCRSPAPRWQSPLAVARTAAGALRSMPATARRRACDSKAQHESRERRRDEHLHATRKPNTSRGRARSCHLASCGACV